jgi:hypothetical protein
MPQNVLEKISISPENRSNAYKIISGIIFDLSTNFAEAVFFVTGAFAVISAGSPDEKI